MAKNEKTLAIDIPTDLYWSMRERTAQLRTTQKDYVVGLIEADIAASKPFTATDAMAACESSETPKDPVQADPAAGKGARKAMDATKRGR